MIVRFVMVIYCLLVLSVFCDNAFARYSEPIAAIGKDRAVLLAVDMVKKKHYLIESFDSIAEEFHGTQSLPLMLTDEQKTKLELTLAGKTFWLVKLIVKRKVSDASFSVYVIIDAISEMEIELPER